LYLSLIMRLSKSQHSILCAFRDLVVILHSLRRLKDISIGVCAEPRIGITMQQWSNLLEGSLGPMHHLPRYSQ
jgi:hypothetical protein